MKRLFAITLAVVMATASIWAEEGRTRANGRDWNSNRSSLSFNAGYASLLWVGASTLSWIPALSTKGVKDLNYFGAYSIQYHNQNFWWFRSGFKMNWEGYRYSLTDAATSAKKGTSFTHLAAIMGSVQFTYLNLKYFQMYAGIDLGLATYVRDDRYDAGYTSTDGKSHVIKYALMPALNVTALGLAVGGEHVYGLLEANVGVEALIKAGIGFRF